MFSKLAEYYNSKKPTSTGAIEYIVAGLGNPGREYNYTRHNAGFIALDYIVEKENIQLKKLKFNALCGDGSFGGKRVLFIEPQTYMNKSGEAIIQAMQFYKIPVERVIVICDDVTQEVGKIRIRRKGSAGGQNGLKNIIALAGGDNFPRIRIGIGQKPHAEMDLADWVLSKFAPKEYDSIKEILPNISRAVELMVKDQIDDAMGRFN